MKKPRKLNHLAHRLCLVSWLLPLVLTACSEAQKETPSSHTSMLALHIDADTGRWYTKAQVAEGKVIFAQNCASCHGFKAEATDDWKTPDAFGNYPPPPLNGSAHAWHHPLTVLDQVIRDGTADMGGNMPAWSSVLNESQRLSVIASFQTYWNDDIYKIWLERDGALRDN